jgi:DNA-binding LacI/PurR family transcriptional regulator
LPITKNQTEAFLACSKNSGASFPEKYIVSGSYDERAGYLKTLEVLEMDFPPTAILLGDDLMTMGALKAINEKGLDCSKDISIAYVDGNQLLQQLHPEITILKSTDILSVSAKMLKHMIEEGNAGSDYSVIIERELVVRESTSLVRSS